MLNSTTETVACNCENLRCAHGEKPCGSVADARKRVMYVGAVCTACYLKMDPIYRLPQR